jgi:type 1 glutamine amidotransferase
MRALIVTLTLALVAGIVPMNAFAQEEGTRVLLLTRSQVFEHSCIAEEDGKPGHVQTVMKGLAEAHGAEFVTTKDAGIINAEDLEDFDLVVFYTTGDLTKKGTDGGGTMEGDGLEALLAWVKAGGAFIGYHCATDTFGHHSKYKERPFAKMVGAEFRTHGEQFAGSLIVVDPDHPTMARVPNGLTLKDEWYLHQNVNTEDIHVLALLDPGAERGKQEDYDVPNYPVIWCSTYGEGRVYYNAMGHREDVWDDKTFQDSVIDAASWVLGEGPADAEPNFAQVSPGSGEEE